MLGSQRFRHWSGRVRPIAAVRFLLTGAGFGFPSKRSPRLLTKYVYCNTRPGVSVSTPETFARGSGARSMPFLVAICTVRTLLASARTTTILMFVPLPRCLLPVYRDIHFVRSGNTGVHQEYVVSVESRKGLRPVNGICAPGASDVERVLVQYAIRVWVTECGNIGNVWPQKVATRSNAGSECRRRDAGVTEWCRSARTFSRHADGCLPSAVRLRLTSATEFFGMRHLSRLPLHGWRKSWGERRPPPRRGCVDFVSGGSGV